ncbi:hypothetical protein C427_0695 [Paraglaciecola psychrophila 170]|uniref:Uncharacterized protein n=1 Tax=Paraglaciecola psychrophila 170 TaxID=1129794 RepID=K6ZL52_9ALTE|nr:hypothetical protein C427_0695 [Paraglaciecola psychrophila 170]GAC36696.1 hypothetical protein GPSY_1058 [Paraglaciecola psychrophila 170]
MSEQGSNRIGWLIIPLYSAQNSSGAVLTNHAKAHNANCKM